MTRTTIISCILFTSLVAAAGCKSDKAKAGGADQPAAAGNAGAAAYAPLTAEPEPAAITPADKAPFEAVQFRMLGKRNKAGWPLYDAYNLGTKPIEFLAIDLYGYDASGKQVVKTSPPLSWNGKLAPGGKTDWELDIGGFGDPIPATAVTFQACYSGIKLEGADTINDFARCPDQRPLAK